MNARNEKYRKKITDVCQPHVDEPIRAVGFFQPRGTIGAAAMTLVGSPFAGARMQGEAQAAAGGVPELGLYALTDSALHVLEGKPKAFNWKVKSYVGNWPRSMFMARPVDGRVTDQVSLTFDNGSTITLESMRMGAQGFNDDIISELLSPPDHPPD